MRKKSFLQSKKSANHIKKISKKIILIKFTFQLFFSTIYNIRFRLGHGSKMSQNFHKLSKINMSFGFRVRKTAANYFFTKDI